MMPLTQPLSVDPDLPRSIYAIEGAKEVAIEFQSFSKNAGFTGTRCAFYRLSQNQ